MTKWTPSTAVLIFSWPTGFPAFSCRQMVSHQCPPGYCAKGLCQIRRNRDEVVVEAQKYRSSHSMRRVYLEISYKRQVNKSTQITIAITWQSHSSSSMRLDKERRQCRFAKVENTRHDGEELWCGFWCDCLTKCQSCIFTLTRPCLGFREHGPNKWKYPVSSICLVENDLFWSGVRYPTSKPINSDWLHYYYPVVPRCT